jgi:predicted nucleic acid-binding protein
LSFVVDNSVFMGWCIPDEQTPKLLGFLQQARDADLFVPAIWPSEFSNVLGKAHRKGRLTSIDVRNALELAAKLKIHVVQGWNNATLHEALVMMHRYSLTSYDASYLALAIEKNMPLATTDNELRAAATMAAVPLVL